MSNFEDEIRDLREKNSELANEVQSWKIKAAQKDKEKLELTKENNELRLKISRLRSSFAAQALKLDAGLQSASEEALSHLVQASGAIARTVQIAKKYIQEREELDLSSPRWCHIGSSNSSAKKVNEVPPLLLGGQSIQPVVSLSRTMINNRSINRSPNQNSGVTHRALPMHMLQDVYIPLTRIDAAELQGNNIETEENTAEGDSSAENLALEDSPEQLAQESINLTTSDHEDAHGLDAVMEESVELEDEVVTPPSQMTQNVMDNPLEGPSWLLDVAGERVNASRTPNILNLEPDSTTPCDTPSGLCTTPLHESRSDEAEKENAPLSVSLAFTPTVRRRKRTSSPPRPSFSPRPARKHITNRILKVVVAKMRLSDEIGGSGDSSPPKRATLVSPPKSPRLSTQEIPDNSSRRTSIDGNPGVSSRRSTVDGRPGDSPQNKDAGSSIRPRFDAPSPNGATDAGVIVCETYTRRLRDSPPPHVTVRATARCSRRDSVASSRDHSRSDSRLDYSDSDHSADTDVRTRRTRKQVSYKEKPLNRKLRR